MYKCAAVGNSKSLSHCMTVMCYMVWPWFPEHMERRSSPSCAFSSPGTKKLHRVMQDISQSHALKTNMYVAQTPAMLCFCAAVGADKQCELTCRPASYRFYVRQAERVRDGTPCFNVSSNDVCVEGRCLVSGFKCACVRFFTISKSPLSSHG